MGEVLKAEFSPAIYGKCLKLKLYVFEILVFCDPGRMTDNRQH